MGAPKCSEDRFISLVETHGIAETSRILGCNERNAHSRRRRIEKALGVPLKVPSLNSPTKHLQEKPERVELRITDGVVLIGSDSHYAPGIVSAAHRAFVGFCKELNPIAVIKNGDELDFPQISRHAPIGWESRPSVVQEMECASERLDEILKASKNAKHIWPLGNHDARFETRLATVAPEYAKVKGLHLHDHFPGWQPCWSVFINDDVVVKHRFKSGIHATHNNTMWAGRTMVTGHLHSLRVTPLTDYNGTRWGVDTGTLADPYGPQFKHYMEDSPRNWRSGFAVLTFHRGELLWPELVHVRNEAKGEVEFRGKVMVV
jgi:hypothetical protein